MAEEQDQASKTEDPTPKRLQDAREKGQVPNSREITSWMILLSFAIFVLAFAVTLSNGLKDILLPFMESPHAVRISKHNLAKIGQDSATDVLLLLSVPLGLALLAAFLGPVSQFGFIFSSEPIIPKISKISLTKGFKRLFSLRAIIEFAKGLLKISIVAVVLVAVLLPDFDDLGKLVIFDVTATLAVLRDESLKLLAAVLFVLAIIAIADFAYQRWEHARNLRMTKQEVKDEFKQTEGDPQIKGKIRQLRNERARKRMMAAVPQADAVITNPIHYAVALRYKQETMQAPIVIAKGSDHLALRIRQIAEENDVPVIENPPLAQALYHGVEIDQEVPQQHYRAVAEVISYVFSLRGRRWDANRQSQSR